MAVWNIIENELLYNDNSPLMWDKINDDDIKDTYDWAFINKDLWNG